MKLEISKCCATCIQPTFQNSRVMHGCCPVLQKKIHRYTGCGEWELDNVSVWKLSYVDALMSAYDVPPPQNQGK